MKTIQHIFRLGVKEIISLLRDPVLLLLIVYCFTFSVYTPSKSAVMEVANASVAVVDEDRSEAARIIRDSLLPPLFLPAKEIPYSEIGPSMDAGKYTFVVNIPPKFQEDLGKDAKPEVSIVTDATAMSQAGRGPSYIMRIINDAVMPFWSGRGNPANTPLVDLNTRARFNANLKQGWFVAINQVINNITLLGMFLTGAAVLREREHGNIEHLLVMPLQSFELMLAKIWANGLAVILTALISLFLVVRLWIGVPVAGSTALFTLGLAIYMFSVTAFGVLLATIVRNMPQFGLLAFPIFIVMTLCSGGQTALESMPVWLQNGMQFMPSTHFVAFAQAVLFRDATFAMVWPDMLKMFVIGAVFSVYTLFRFRKMLAAVQ